MLWLVVIATGVVGDGVNETLRDEFCVKALRKRVVPGKSYGLLDDNENRIWRMLRCTDMFCSEFVKGRCRWTDFGRRAVLENDRRVNENCGKQEKSMTLLTTMPNVPRRAGELDAHWVEVLLAVGENSRHFAHVRVLVDQGEEESATLLLRQAVYECQRVHGDKVDVRATPADLRKISARIFGRQPSYADIFDYANNHVGGLVTLANADVVVRNLEAVDADSLRRDKLVLVLSISPPTGSYAKQCPRDDVLASRCEFWDLAYGVSWDAYVFSAPLLSLNFSFLDPPEGKSPIYMNAINAENCAGNFLVASGYTLSNPCRTIKAEHWHCMGTKTHHDDSRERKWERECAQRTVYHRRHGDHPPEPIKITKSLTLGHVGGPGTLCSSD